MSTETVPARRPSRFAQCFGAIAGLIIVAAAACADEAAEGENANNNVIANNNTMDAPECATVLPEAVITCDAPGCSATTGTRTVAQAELDSAEASRWVVIAYKGSGLYQSTDEAANPLIDLTYTLDRTGGLVARRGELDRATAALRHAARHDQLRRTWGEATYASVFGAERRARLAADRRLRAAWPREPLSLEGVTGTAITSAEPEGNPNYLGQQTACSISEPACGPSALCVIAPNETDGTCRSSLQLKFRPDLNQPGMTVDVTATVRAVGELGAIVVDDADTVSDADVATLLDRFERRIAPLDHAFFGLPRTTAGADRDGNGVVILFFTSRVRQLDPNLVGFFQALDLGTSPASNQADILYMHPPADGISIDQLSGTIGHEYQHLINYYAKVINQSSSQEELWLDEGLSSFAEDMLGYGQDAFRNVAAYLTSVADTSLTGPGLTTAPGEEDSLERRGAAHLLVRYVFEQAGGAEYDDADPGVVTDGGGVAAVRRLLDSADTGLDLFEGSGRTFPEWVRDLMTTVAVDGAGIPDVSCNPRFTFAPPQIDAFTGFQRGIDLRTSIEVPGGTAIPLNGPVTIEYLAESVPVPLNGGEIRILTTNSGTARIGLIGPVDEDIATGLRVLPDAR